MSEIKISNESLPARLYAPDTRHIKRRVAEFGGTDTRFKDKTAAVRHYVHLGIVTEKRTETANTLEDRIIKTAQKEVVIETLLPVKNSIDALIEAMQNFDRKQDAHFLDATKQNNTVIRRLEEFFYLAEKSLQKLSDDVISSGVGGEEILRNIVILRSIQYVFLLGYKTGKIEPDEKVNWEYVVRLAHEKARELSYAELESLTAGAGESPHIEKLARDIFVAIRDAKNRLS